MLSQTLTTVECYEVWVKLLIHPEKLSEYNFDDTFILEFLLQIAINDGLRSFQSEFDNNSKNSNNNNQAANRLFLMSDSFESEFQAKKNLNIRYLTFCFLVLLKQDCKNLAHSLNSRQLEFILSNLNRIYDSEEIYPLEMRRYALLMYFRLLLAFIAKNLTSVKRRQHHVLSIVAPDPQSAAEHEQYLFQRHFGECSKLVDSIERIYQDQYFWPSKPTTTHPQYSFILSKLSFDRESVGKDVALYKKVKQPAISKPENDESKVEIGFSKPLKEQTWQEELETDCAGFDKAEFDTYFKLAKDFFTGSSTPSLNTPEVTRAKSKAEKLKKKWALGADKTQKSAICEFNLEKNPERILELAGDLTNLTKAFAEKHESFFPIRVLRKEREDKKITLNEETFRKAYLLLVKVRQLRQNDDFKSGLAMIEAFRKDIKKVTWTKPILAAIDLEQLYFDIQVFRSRFLDEDFKTDLDALKARIVDFLGKLDEEFQKEKKYETHRELVSMSCHFLLDFAEDAMKEQFRKCNHLLPRFASALCFPLTTTDSRDKCLELWNVTLGILSAVKPQGNRMTLSQSQSEYFAFVDFLKRITNFKFRLHILTLFSKLYNILRNNSMSGSINLIQGYTFPDTIVSNYKKNIDVREFSTLFNELLRHYLQDHYNVPLLQAYAEFLVAEDPANCDLAFQYFLRVLMLRAGGLSSSELENCDDLLSQMIACSSRGKYHFRAAVLYQFQIGCRFSANSPATQQANNKLYQLAFKEMSQDGSRDSLGQYLNAIWDITFLEWLHSNERFHPQFGSRILSLIKLSELNENNPTDMRKQAIAARARLFFNRLLQPISLC